MGIGKARVPDATVRPGSDHGRCPPDAPPRGYYRRSGLQCGSSVQNWVRSGSGLGAALRHKSRIDQGLGLRRGWLGGFVSWRRRHLPRRTGRDLRPWRAVPCMSLDPMNIGSKGPTRHGKWRRGANAGAQGEPTLPSPDATCAAPRQESRRRLTSTANDISPGNPMAVVRVRGLGDFEAGSRHGASTDLLQSCGPARARHPDERRERT